MIRPSADLNVYLCREPVDMRKQIDGLALLVQEVMDLNPFDQALFVFGNRQRDKVKLLFWERNGFVVWYKRLERERFKWPTHLEGDSVTLSGQELNWLLDGVDLKAVNPHKALYFQCVG
ncbi:IS66 family insertion sequence element accessory protein TnpB [Vreelandella rituensis]|uniref:Transposase n=1 Tax=Vreelandella rituensis TaxID=2282306 RepID=A0A368TMG6_9GAMM|nr:IS66 family insertion sequence element accessory protein TnpB [Halomonas rituensis]RCV85855.1 transposase [Halomonas rituensis]